MQTSTKRSMLEKFTDNTAGERYSRNRLITRETAAGNVALIAYGWLKLAEYDERRGAVTVFTGHKAIGSVAVTRYINDVIDVAQDRVGRDVILSGQSPTVDTPNEGVKYVGNYVNFVPDRSAVEQAAVETVERSLAFLA